MTYRNPDPSTAAGVQIREAVAHIFQAKSHLEQAAGVVGEILGGGGAANQAAVHSHVDSTESVGVAATGQAIHDEIVNLKAALDLLFDGGTVNAQRSILNRYNPGT